MAIRPGITAVVFDIGGVLERVDDPDRVIGRKWRAQLRLTEDEYTAAIGTVDPYQLNQIGRMSEAEYSPRSTPCSTASLSRATTRASMWSRCRLAGCRDIRPRWSGGRSVRAGAGQQHRGLRRLAEFQGGG